MFLFLFCMNTYADLHLHISILKYLSTFYYIDIISSYDVTKS